MVSVGEFHKDAELYSLEDINGFLDETYKKKIKKKKICKFTSSTDVLKRLIGWF